MISKYLAMCLLVLMVLSLGRIFGPKDHTLQAGATSTGTQDMNAMVNQEVEERQSLLSNSFEASTCSEVAIEIPQTVKWKKMFIPCDNCVFIFE